MYTCVATNAAGSVSSSASLTVSGQPQTSETSTMILEINSFFQNKLMFPCALSGTNEDGSEVIWKSGFDSLYTEITELGRYNHCNFVCVLFIA